MLSMELHLVRFSTKDLSIFCPSRVLIMYNQETSLPLFNPLLSNLDFRILCSQDTCLSPWEVQAWNDFSSRGVLLCSNSRGLSSWFPRNGFVAKNIRCLPPSRPGSLNSGSNAVWSGRILWCKMVFCLVVSLVSTCLMLTHCPSPKIFPDIVTCSPGDRVSPGWEPRH